LNETKPVNDVPDLRAKSLESYPSSLSELFENKTKALEMSVISEIVCV
jgi:hypothetical protein